MSKKVGEKVKKIKKLSSAPKGNRSTGKKQSGTETFSKTLSTGVFQPDPLKSDMVRQALVTLLWKKEELTYPDLVQQLRQEIGEHFNGDIDMYIQWVCSYLSEKKLLEESPGKKPVHYRLAQKLDSDENANENPADQAQDMQDQEEGEELEQDD